MRGIAAPIVPLVATTAVADGVGPALDLHDVRATVRLTLTVSAASGTLPTLAVSIETSPDAGAAEWLIAGSFAHLFAAGGKDLQCVGVARFIRARWTIGGDTPSFSFGIAGRAVTSYTNEAFIKAMGVDEEAIGEVDEQKIKDCASAASRDFDRFIWLRATPLPEAEVTLDVIKDTSIIAAYHLMSVRGFDASKTDAQNIILRYQDVLRRGAALDGGRKLPPFDTGPATTDTIQIATRPRRGWGRGGFGGFGEGGHHR